jgi:hypothetical protein
MSIHEHTADAVVYGMRAVVDEPTSSVAVALADKAAARARRDLERQQDWQCFIRQESARFMAALIEAGNDDFSWAARRAVDAAQALWDRLPDGCKL